MGFVYSLLLKCLYPTSVAVLLGLGALVVRRRPGVRAWLGGGAIGVILVCGNGWLVAAMAEHLESQFPAPDPIPTADCVVVLGGGTLAVIPPRRTVEVAEAGDRVLHAARLMREGKAPLLFCTSGVATGGVALRPPSEDMADLAEFAGVSREAIVLETASGNTREHARNLASVFQSREIHRVLLVTSAMHMPRSIGVFRAQCPEVEFVPCPTDYRIVGRIPQPWYREVSALFPTPGNLELFSEAAHEYLGYVYYRVRGWI